jgi:hypothetical protein
VTRAPGQAGRRERAETTRENVVKVRLSDEEAEVLGAAAGRAGMALAAWLAQAGMDAAEHRALPVPVMLREILAELFRVRGLVRRIGVNLNQAVAKLNATGQQSGDLPRYAEESIRRAARLEAAAEDLRARFLRAIRPPGPHRPATGPCSAPPSAGPG